MPVTRWLRERVARIAAAGRRGRLDADLREEMAHHLELRRQQLVAEGMDPREALYEARRMFGNTAKIREESRDLWGFRMLDTLLQDARYGARMLRRSPLVTLVAVASLAIGIGATTAVFSLYDALVFKTLPVRAPDELILVRWSSGPVQPFGSLNGQGHYTVEGYSSTSFPKPAFETMRATLAGRAEIFGFADMYRINVAVDGRPEKAAAQAVSGNYFDALGVLPAAGRLISALDDRAGADPVAVLGFDYWQRRFGGTQAVGRPLVLNGVAVTIVGVAPRRFRGTLQVGQQQDVMVPLSLYPAVTRSRDAEDPNHWWVLLMGRLGPGTTAREVQAQADLVLKRTVAAARPHPASGDLPQVSVEPGARGQTEDRDRMREPLTAMALVVAVVLFVACANVSNLLLARGRARVREMAVRVAIGASRGRVIRQLLTEGLLLSFAGSVLGLAFATTIASALIPAVGVPPDVYATMRSLDIRIVAFTVALASICSLAFGLAPAFRATDVRLAVSLREASRDAPGTRRRRGVGSVLVVAQVAMSMTLVTAAALLVYSVRNLTRVNPGFDPGGILLFRIDPGQSGYDPQRSTRLYTTAIERLSALPGVRSASLSSHTLISGGSSMGAARRAGAPAPSRDSPEAPKFAEQNRAYRLTVDERFFDTFRIPIKAGRALSASDSAQSQRVAVINESLARQLFATTDAVGRRFIRGLAEQTEQTEVVGVAADAKYTSVRREAPPTAYLSYRQEPTGSATLAIRVDGDPAAVAESVRETMRQIDASLPLSDMETQVTRISRSLSRERFFARLAALLGVVTLVLAAIGLYGLLAYAVTRRTPEIGVRMALGASRAAVRWMILRQSLVMVVAGLAIGVPGAIAGSRFVASMLFGTTPTNPLAIAGAAAAMLAISLAASLVPARRAARVDPIVALRAD